jgi:peptidoglycan/LPS O-acetylase OafA/YrhL
MHLDRHRIRSLGALASWTMALIYYLIGLGVLGIGGSRSDESVDLRVFGFSAGTAFLILGLLLMRTDRRWVWVLAAIAQVWVFLVYFMVSGTREPPFEIWGIALRLIQVPLLVILVYLAWRPAQGASHRGSAA